MLIYRATNNINGKVYIGKTIKSLRSRISEHKSDINRGQIFYFQRALIKYGFDNFTWDVLDETNSLDELNRLEIQYIDTYDSKNKDKGYNIADGGMGGGNRCGAILSESTKTKISNSKRGISWGTHRDETKQIISTKLTGRQFTESHKDKLKKARSNRIISTETKQRMRQSSKGRINIKKFKLVDPSGIVYETTHGLTTFCSEHGLSAPNLHKILKGERTHHKGWSISIL